MPISFKTKGSFNKTQRFLSKLESYDITDILKSYGEAGVILLSDATPKDTGKTAASWYYVTGHEPGRWKVVWCNDNVNDGVNIAIILQYGHGTNNGAYVEGIDYINPTMEPVFQAIADAAYERLVKYYGNNS